MLFGRFTDESKLESVVLPAFREYLDVYVTAMAVAVPDTRPESMEVVRQRQAAYDAYSALKDPAVGLFDAYFGKEWSAEFVHEFLFSLSGNGGGGSGGGIGSGGLDPPQAHRFQIDAKNGAVVAAGRPHQ
jgi:uncharacterized membrane protein